jgi:cytidylate kinase
VVDARDAATVVFPDAELKIFLETDIDVKSERRWKELKER